MLNLTRTIPSSPSPHLNSPHRDRHNRDRDDLELPQSHQHQDDEMPTHGHVETGTETETATQTPTPTGTGTETALLSPHHEDSADADADGGNDDDDDHPLALGLQSIQTFVPTSSSSSHLVGNEDPIQHHNHHDPHPHPHPDPAPDPDPDPTSSFVQPTPSKNINQTRRVTRALSSHTRTGTGSGIGIGTETETETGIGIGSGSGSNSNRINPNPNQNENENENQHAAAADLQAFQTMPSLSVSHLLDTKNDQTPAVIISSTGVRSRRLGIERPDVVTTATVGNTHYNNTTTANDNDDDDDDDDDDIQLKTTDHFGHSKITCIKWMEMIIWEKIKIYLHQIQNGWTAMVVFCSMIGLILHFCAANVVVEGNTIKRYPWCIAVLIIAYHVIGLCESLILSLTSLTMDTRLWKLYFYGICMQSTFTHICFFIFLIVMRKYQFVSFYISERLSSTIDPLLSMTVVVLILHLIRKIITKHVIWNTNQRAFAQHVQQLLFVIDFIAAFSKRSNRIHAPVSTSAVSRSTSPYSRRINPSKSPPMAPPTHTVDIGDSKFSSRHSGPRTISAVPRRLDVDRGGGSSFTDLLHDVKNWTIGSNEAREALRTPTSAWEAAQVMYQNLDVSHKNYITLDDMHAYLPDLNDACRAFFICLPPRLRVQLSEIQASEEDEGYGDAIHPTTYTMDVTYRPTQFSKDDSQQQQQRGTTILPTSGLAMLQANKHHWGGYRYNKFSTNNNKSDKQNMLVIQWDVQRLRTLRITQKQFTKAIQSFVEDRKQLALKITDWSSLSEAFRAFSTFVLVLVSIFTLTVLFSENVNGFLLPMTTLILSFSFMFGNTVKTILEAFLFIFVMKPFAIGDRIELLRFDMRGYLGDEYEIHSIQLFTTTVRSSDNKLVIIPNATLGASAITNLTRSVNPAFRIPLIVKSATTTQELTCLKNRLLQYVHSHDRWLHRVSINFPVNVAVNASGIVLNIPTTTPPTSITLYLRVIHSSDYRHIQKVKQDLYELQQYVDQQAIDLNIAYTDTPTPYTAPHT